ncbi:hypothetical protein [Rhodohalobacter sulfatireducens]|uniref:Uncharacterized protein n=1 Tax=Rhodohalobacter sulfatireducens TaxID=2911366 RepID=A0ABS9KF97_9BACT|nr:hypothetical protein [Rhodohalobacter sulfatireducens]MCG2589524.1 hypothetical protein [Rhodohalobacter sulfatireducens]
MSEEQMELFQLLETAVNKVYQEERPLLQYEDEGRIGLEQAFVFRTGIYLQQLILDTEYANLDVDSEYNKNHNGFKVTANHPKGIRPDLLLHERNTHTNNKLAVEFKGVWTSKAEWKKDTEKLKDITCDEYDYTLGVFVLIGNEDARNQIFFLMEEK